MTFEDWLLTATKSNGDLLSRTSVKRYTSGLKVVSDIMLTKKVISKHLENMNIYELDVAICLISQDADFIAKNKKGNKMYSNALKRYRLYKKMNTDIGILEVIEEVDINKDVTLKTTEKEVLIKARRGQGQYREDLLKKYCSKCIMTDIDIKQVLIASHIKPWAVCDNSERIDVNNGLILSATYDRLFDDGLITFDINGKIYISSMISNFNRSKLGLSAGKKYDIKYNSKMADYIKYHNEVIFIK